MAGQGIFLRTINIVGNCRQFLNNRIGQINLQPQIAGLKHNDLDKLKEQMNIPEKPKRPSSAFLRFAQDQRPSLLKENPGLKITEITKKCAAQWKIADESIKQKYVEESQTEYKRYAREYAEYKSKLTEEQLEALEEARAGKSDAKAKRQLNKKIRESNRPKRPVAAYTRYAMDQSKIQNKPYPELMSSLKTQWDALPESQKAKYIKAAEDEKRKYSIEMEAWEKKMIAAGNTDVIRRSTLEALEKNEDQRQSPSKRSQSKKRAPVRESTRSSKDEIFQEHFPEKKSDHDCAGTYREITVQESPLRRENHLDNKDNYSENTSSQNKIIVSTQEQDSASKSDGGSNTDEEAPGALRRLKDMFNFRKS